LRIAMLHPSLTIRGGAERQLLILATILSKMGHEVELFTCAVNEDCYPELAKNLTVNVIKTPYSRTVQKVNQKRTLSSRLAGRFRGYTTDLPSMFLLGKKIPKGFDIINNQNSPTQWAAFFAKKKLDAPIVWNCNEPPFYYSDVKQQRGLGKINSLLYDGFDKIAVNYIDSIVSVSSVDTQRIKKAYGRVSQIVRPGVSSDLLQKASGKFVKGAYGLENAFVLLQVGNIAEDKRQLDSVKALYHLSQKYDNIKLILVGQGPRTDIVDLSRKLNIKDKVIFFQNCSDEDLAQIYAACDVFIFPAQITWGLAVIEAMVASKPVLVSTKAGASEIIREGQNGFLIREPYAINMAANIEKLIKDPELRRKMGKNAYEYTKENLSWEIYARKMETVFQQTINNYRKMPKL